MTSPKRAGAYLVLAAVLGAVSVGAASPARAEQQTAYGTWALVHQTMTPLDTANGDSFFAVVESPAYTGDFIGTATDRYLLIVHSDGTLNAYGVESCTACTIGGRTGDFKAVFSFAGSANGGSGVLTFTSGQGQLAGLHGGGTFQSFAPMSGTYAYEYDFTP